MNESEEYPGFIEVKPKFKIDDIVDWYRYGEKNRFICTCIITKVCRLADHEDNFEPSYIINELVNGRMTEESISGGAYEGELVLNKKFIRERKLEKILGVEPSGRMTEDE